MIKLDFQISGMETYDQYLVNYQGLDLSFLNLNVDKYINTWAMPYISRTVDEREITLVYSVPSKAVAESIANTALLGSGSTMIFSKDNPDWKAQCYCESATWDVFTNKIQVTVKYIMESGFIHKVTYANTQLLIIPVERLGIASALDWGVTVKPAPGADLFTNCYIYWEVKDRDKKVLSRFNMNTTKSPGARGEIYFDTKHIDRSYVSASSLPVDIKEGSVIFKGELLPEIVFGGKYLEFSCAADKPVEVTWFIYRRELLP